MMTEIDCTIKKMSKEGNVESKKRFMYVNPKITSNTQVAFSLYFPYVFHSCCYLFFIF